MYEVTREMRFCYGHRILNHGGKCKHLHGHNGRVRVTIAAEELDALGMVVDFSNIKRQLRTWIMDNLDHRMILQRGDPALPPLQELGEPVVVVDHHPTAEHLARVIFDAGRAQGFDVRRVEFWETDDCFAVYTGEE